IHDAVRDKIRNHSWPGNVRQLENAMIYATNVCHDNLITLDCLPEAILREKAGLAVEAENAPLSMEGWERTAIKIALMRTNNNIPLAAELLEVSKATLYRKIKDYNIKT
ncbi:MAG TPA: helix-turn-helix domain-containing protein, partial [Patescibacteria group bacterium]|nr:helix-turn-helix domain-containing protein [Patescibacteria group bacterium]